MKKRRIIIIVACILFTAVVISIMIHIIGRDYSGYAEKQVEFESEFLELQKFKFPLPTQKQAKKIEIGMSVREVASLIGRPQSNYGSGMVFYVWKLNNGGALHILFGSIDYQLVVNRIELYNLWGNQIYSASA